MLSRHVRDGFRKARALLKLRLARGIKDNKSFYNYIGSKRLNKGNVSPLRNGVDDLVTADADKAEQLDAYLVSVFTNKVSQCAVLGDGVQE